MVARHVFFLIHLHFLKIITGFSGKKGEIIPFTVVTIFQRFFSLRIVYRSIITPEYIYFIYHGYTIMDLIMIL